MKIATLCLGIVLGLSSVNAIAKKIETKIVHIQPSRDARGFHEVFATYNGRVYEVASDNLHLLQSLYIAKESGATIKVKVEEGAHFELLNVLENVTSVEALSFQSNRTKGRQLAPDPMRGYSPSNIESQAQAKNMFNRLENNTKWFSQCFNRAHIWSKQMEDFYGVKSMKILIYYTQKYREDVDKKWWFHIAPMIKVNGENIVMDKEFFRAPVNENDWEREFTQKMEDPLYRCKKIKNISEYYEASNYYEEYCNIQHASMYYWEPSDLEKLEKEGLEKTGWVEWEINAAAKQAFRGWRDLQKRHAHK